MKKNISTRDVSQLPTHASGAQNPLWWGTQAFMVIEGLAFVFAIAAYLYLYNQNDNWPLAPQPGLMWSTIFTVAILLSEIPNIWVKRAAEKNDLKKVRWGLITMSAIGILVLGIRVFEFNTLNVRWDDNAYGSIVWFILGYHTVHLLTDVAETLVMTFAIYWGPVDLRRFPEVEDNQDYWHFVVFFWIVTYVTIYWLPRWLENLP
jgi:cytochrome c oxidase subunit 3